MPIEQQRSYRTDLNLHGMIYLNEEERDIIIKNLSITGLLAELDQQQDAEKAIKDIFNSLHSSSFLDIFIPSMRMAGEMEVIRADAKKNKILIALEFKSVSYDVEDFIYKRKVYRKRMPGPGRILLNGNFHPFTAVNVSVDGLMIVLNKQITIQETNEMAYFEFINLGLTGEASIIWTEYPRKNETLIGLRYVHLKQGQLHGIPCFVNR